MVRFDKNHQLGIKFEDAFEDYLQRNNIRYHRGLKLRNQEGDKKTKDWNREIDFIVPGAMIETKAGRQDPAKLSHRTNKQMLNLLELAPKSIDLYFVHETARTEAEVAACLEHCTLEDRKRVHFVSRFEDVHIQPLCVLLPSAMSVWHMHHSTSQWVTRFIQKRLGCQWIASTEDLSIGLAAAAGCTKENKPIIQAYECKSKADMIADVAAGKLGFVEAYLFSAFPGQQQNKYETGWTWLPRKKVGVSFHSDLIFYLFPAPMETGKGYLIRQQFEKSL